MPPGYDKAQDLRSSVDPIEDDGPGRRHQSMQSGKTRALPTSPKVAHTNGASGRLPLTVSGSGGGAAGGSGRKAKVPSGIIKPRDSLNNTPGSGTGTKMLGQAKRKPEERTTEDSPTAKRQKSVHHGNVIASKLSGTNNEPLITSDEEEEDAMISPHFAKTATKDNKESKARTAQKLDQRLETIKSFSRFVNGITGPSKEKSEANSATAARVDHPKNRPKRTLKCQERKAKSDVTVIPLAMFQRGRYVLGGNNVQLLLDHSNGTDGIEVIPQKSSGETFKDLSFGFRDMSSHFYFCHDLRTFCIALRANFYNCPPNKYIMFRTENEEGAAKFCKIYSQYRGFEPAQYTKTSVENWVAKFIIKTIRDLGFDDTIEPSTDQDQELQVREEKDRKFAVEIYNKERRRTTRGGSMQIPAEVEITQKPQAPRANGAVQNGAPPRTRQSSRLTVPTSPKAPAPKAPKLQMPPKWKSSLLYPFEGPKRANVDYIDLDRLNDEEFLNDNLMNFYLRYLEETMRKRNPELADRTHFFNTYFYERLSTKGDEEARLRAVLKWTSKIDVFSKDYIIIPINESSHWYLALVCNLSHLDRRLKAKAPETVDDAAAESDATITTDNAPSKTDNNTVDDEPMPDAVQDTQEKMEVVSLSDEEPEWPEDEGTYPTNPKLDEKNRGFRLTKHGIPEKPADKKKRERVYQQPDTPCIIILDSMSSGGVIRHGGALKHIRKWLSAEANEKRSLQLSKEDIQNVYGKAPSQTNWYDCGLYVLHYVEKFIDDASTFVTGFLKGRSVDVALWDEDSIHNKRKSLFDLIIRLHNEFIEHENKKKSAPESTEPTNKSPPVEATSAVASPAPPTENMEIEEIRETSPPGLKQPSPSPKPDKSGRSSESPDIPSDTIRVAKSAKPSTSPQNNVNGLAIFDHVYRDNEKSSDPEPTIPDTPPENRMEIDDDDELEQVDQIAVGTKRPLPWPVSQLQDQPSLKEAWGIKKLGKMDKLPARQASQPASPVRTSPRSVSLPSPTSEVAVQPKHRLRSRRRSPVPTEDDDCIMITSSPTTRSGATVSQEL